jgi:hypothetical protein
MTARARWSPPHLRSQVFTERGRAAHGVYAAGAPSPARCSPAPEPARRPCSPRARASRRRSPPLNEGPGPPPPDRFG